MTILDMQLFDTTRKAAVMNLAKYDEDGECINIGYRLHGKYTWLDATKPKWNWSKYEYEVFDEISETEEQKSEM